MINWQIQRGQLNHNWLENGVLVALNHAMRLASGEVRSSVVCQALAEDILKWEERRNDVPGFLDRFENEMSPKAFFDRIPLRRCSERTKSWLVPLTHELWLQRYRVKEKIATALNCYEGAELAYQEVSATLDNLPKSNNVEVLRLLEPSIRKFTDACEALSKAISAMPHEIIP